MSHYAATPMSRTTFTTALLPLLALASSGCSGAPESSEADTTVEAADVELTSLAGTERPVQFQSYVYQPTDASDAAIGDAIARQVKTALGALRVPQIGLRDRAASNARNPSKWTRETVTVQEGATPTAAAKKLLRVRYTYDDRAIVAARYATLSSAPLTLLFGDYAAKADAVRASCSDDRASETASLWYHFSPELSSCRTLQTQEAAALTAERKRLGANPLVVGTAEVGRMFMPLTMRLGTSVAGSTSAAPEYDRLYGFGTDRSTVQVYAFFGVDTDSTNPNDALGREAVTFLRALLRAMPNLRVVRTAPFAMLLDLFVDGTKVEGVTYEKLTGWILGEIAYPAALGSDAAKILAFRKQCLEKLTERAIDLSVPLTVKRGAETVARSLNVRFFYGYEDGSAPARQNAQWRYLEAFWHGDVFLYNGHSHFGHGPLEPTAYASANFNDRYQLMLVNSCLSYNYYHDDFFALKPGGTKNLDKIVNGLPSSVRGSGAVTAALLAGLFNGTQAPYATLLRSMQTASPGQMQALRLVDGELDNTFSQSKTPLTVTVGAPAY
jgi:hypothetical protein